MNKPRKLTTSWFIDSDNVELHLDDEHIQQSAKSIKDDYMDKLTSDDGFITIKARSGDDKSLELFTTLRNNTDDEDYVQYTWITVGPWYYQWFIKLIDWLPFLPAKRWFGYEVLNVYPLDYETEMNDDMTMNVEFQYMEISNE